MQSCLWVPAMPKVEIPHTWHALLHMFRTFHSNQMIESRTLQPDHKILDSTVHFVTYAVAYRSIESRSYVYMFCRIHIPRFHICSMQHCGSICDIAVSICFGHPSHSVTYFSWESLPGHWNRMVESRMLQPRS